MDQVIEISSSPEPQPLPKTRQRPRTRSRGTKRYDDVIDISDEDEDVPLASQVPSSKKKTWVHESAEAGPSRSGPSVPVCSPQVNLPFNATGGSSRLTEQSPDSLLPSKDKDTLASEHVPLFLLDEDLPVTVHSSKTPIPHPTPDLIDVHIARVLEVVPDVQPEHVRTLLARHINTHKDGLVAFVLHMLFEDSNYPKVDTKGKRKREEVVDVDNQESERAKTRIKIDYGSKNRPPGGVLYLEIALVRSVPMCLTHTDEHATCRTNYSSISR